MSKRKYFGTDGIRGEVGIPPITPDFVLKLGWAAGKVLAGNGRRRVLIGKDTRISGYMFESVLEAGLSAAGVDVRLLGPMPTPAIAYLTRTFHASAGIVISASHNAYQDNGIKFFSSEGTKLPDEVELEIEAAMELPLKTVKSSELGKVARVTDAAGRYIEFCKSTVPTRLSLRGMRLVLDCAHGATYHVAPSVFRELDAEVITIGDNPDGLNINDGVGAVAPTALQEAVLHYRADLGIAFDGDGDRVMMVDRHGETVDGDELMLIIADAKRREGILTGPVVGTLMTNLGLEHALAERGLELVRAKVGDRYVLEQLEATGGVLGGETSGHIICRDRVTTGDAIVAALQVVNALIHTGQGLHEIKRGMRKYPQSLINVRMDSRRDVTEIPDVQSAVREVEQELGDRGRVLLRMSGTEPLVRVMVEGRDKIEVERLAGQLADRVESIVRAAAA
ncbi:MAG: phosphoglucosamine mutase [Gammaproteobacteria bacterium]|nr:phosphoglucosamine mutase [Gammaproteobacteria bacterium]